MKKITKIEPVAKAQLTKLKVAAYARVSTSNKEQLLSLENQKTHYESLIKSNPSWEFVKLYFDEGISGTSLDKRAGLKELIRDCELGKIDFIMTKSISRFARNALDCLELVRKLMDLNILIEFEKENINTKTMDGELMLSILSSLAESESKSSSQNIQWAIEKKFQNGTYKIGYPPFGYDWNGEMIINEEQAIIVREIFARILAGHSTDAIAKYLNEQNIPTKRGKVWHSTTIRGIIKNEKYLGHVRFGKTFTDDNFKRNVNRGEKNQYFMENHHPAIIDEITFSKAQEMISRNAKSKGITKDDSKYQNRYSFSGIIKCSECGGMFKRRIQTKSKDKQYVAWTCGNHLKDIHSCTMKFIRDEQIKQAFIIMMNKLIFANQVIMKPLLTKVKARSDDATSTNVSDFKKEYKRIEEQLKNLAQFVASGYIEQTTYLNEKNELIKELQELERIKTANSKLLHDEVEILKNLEELMAFTRKTKVVDAFEEELFSIFISEITIVSRNEVIFHLHCGLNLKERLVTV